MKGKKMAATIWIKLNDTEWQGSKGREHYRILKKPMGRGRYTYHGYLDSAYIANGKTLEECQINIDAYIRTHS
jgi:hypothetical protein